MKKALIAVMLCIALLLTGCQSKAAEPRKQSTVVFYFDTVVTITVYSDDENILSGLDEECLRYENMLSKTVEGSDVWNINHAKGERVAVNEETRELILTALEFSRLSDGRFDITVEPCVALWDFTSEDRGALPDADELAAAAEKVDWTKVDVNDEGVLIPEGMSIDLGAIAKGYISDRIADYFVEKGVESALLNVGGNVRTVGLKPDGSNWRIGIQDPEGVRDQSIVGVATLGDNAVVTSGIYERGFILDDVVYHHILDPETGYGVESDLTSATIIGESSIDCDALATVCVLLGSKKAAELIENTEGFEAVFINSKGKITYTSGILREENEFILK